MKQKFGGQDDDARKTIICSPITPTPRPPNPEKLLCVTHMQWKGKKNTQNEKQMLV